MEDSHRDAITFLAELLLLFSPATFDQLGGLPCQNIEQVKIVFRGLMGYTPKGRDHPDDFFGASDQRRGLAGANADLKIDLLNFWIGHEIAGSYVWRDHPPIIAQRDSAATFRVCAYPLKRTSGVGIESPESQQPQFSACSALWIQPLHTGTVGAHESYSSIDNLFVHNPLAGSQQIGVVLGQTPSKGIKDWQKVFGGMRFYYVTRRTRSYRGISYAPISIFAHEENS